MSHSKSGFTLLEIMIALSIASIALYSLTSAVGTSSALYNESSSNMNIDTLGSRTMRRVVQSLRKADDDSIATLPMSPFNSDTIQFEFMQPYDGTSSEPGGPRSISMSNASVVWTDNPGLPGELSSIWCGDVPQLFEGEDFNGVDDNGNGLIDETGLYFTRDGTTLQIGLTLSKDGLTRSWTTSLSCRN